MTWKNIFNVSSIVIGLGLFSTSVLAQTPTFVDKEIILEIDVSNSISNSDMQLVFDGYSNALRNSTIQGLIEQSTDGYLIGIQMFASGQSPMIRNSTEFFTGAADATPIPTPSTTGAINPFALGSSWFLLKTANEANALADIFDYIENFGGAVRRPARTSNFVANSANCSTENQYADNIGFGTNIGGAIQQGTCEINRNINPSTGGEYISNYERIIDISTDGIQNTNIQGSAQPFGAGLDNECNISIAQLNACQTALNTGKSQALAPSTITGSGITANDEPIDRINAIGIDVTPTVAPAYDYVNDYLGSKRSVPGNVRGYYMPTNALSANGDSECQWNTITGALDSTNYGGSPPAGVVGTLTTCTAANSVLIGNVIQGEGAFVQDANGFIDFNNPGIINKLEQELQPVPFEFSPGLGLILGLGIFGYRGWKLSETKQHIKLNQDIEKVKIQEIESPVEK